MSGSEGSENDRNGRDGQDKDEARGGGWVGDWKMATGDWFWRTPSE